MDSKPTKTPLWRLRLPEMGVPELVEMIREGIGHRDEDPPTLDRAEAALDELAERCEVKSGF